MMNKRKADRIGASVFLAFIAILSVCLLLNLRRLREAGERYEDVRTAQGDAEHLAETAARNPDVIGFLTVEGTEIRCAVVQGTDNLTYLNTNADGEESFAGTPFLDCRNAADFTDPYSVIYGHLMEDHLMFGDLQLFEDEAFWTEERRGKLLLTDGSEIGIRFVAYLRADSEDSRFFDPLRVRNNWNEEFLNDMAGEFRISTEKIGTGDCILALSTCTAFESEERIMILGKLNRTEG